MKFKVGDHVQLHGLLPFTKAGRVMQPNEKGVVTAVTHEDYTVEFDDSMTPIEHLKDEELQTANR